MPTTPNNAQQRAASAAKVLTAGGPGRKLGQKKGKKGRNNNNNNNNNNSSSTTRKKNQTKHNKNNINTNATTTTQVKQKDDIMNNEDMVVVEPLVNMNHDPTTTTISTMGTTTAASEGGGDPLPQQRENPSSFDAYNDKENNHEEEENYENQNYSRSSSSAAASAEKHAATTTTTIDDLYKHSPDRTSAISKKRVSVIQAPDDTTADDTASDDKSKLLWLFLCFLGIMFSFVAYGLLLEHTTSGGRKLHELSFLFVTSALYTITAAAGRYVRDETPSTIPPARFAVLGMTSMGSTFCSVRSLRYVIYPIQVLAKSCKPVPVMLMGALMGKKYPAKKYFNVALIVGGVALFMGGGEGGGKKHPKTSGDGGDGSGETETASQLFGILLLFISLCFDGGTGAYEDKLMSVHSVQPFDLMYNIQLGKTILAGIGLLVLNQVHVFIQMCQEMGFLLVALGFTGAMGQVFIFVTIAKFGALTCSIIGLSRKVTTLVASIYFFGHSLNAVQFTGLAISVTAMVLNFLGKKKGGGGHGGHGGSSSGGHGGPAAPSPPEEMEKMLPDIDEDDEHDDEEEGHHKAPFTDEKITQEEDGDVELGPLNPPSQVV